MLESWDTTDAALWRFYGCDPLSLPMSVYMRLVSQIEVLAQMESGTRDHRSRAKRMARAAEGDW